VVDDDADCRETVAAVLEPEGYDVVLLQNGDEALEYVRNIGLIRSCVSGTRDIALNPPPLGNLPRAPGLWRRQVDIRQTLGLLNAAVSPHLIRLHDQVDCDRKVYPALQRLWES